MTKTIASAVDGKITYADEDELLAFANEVREAGAAKPLEALLPSRPGESQSCLIANALNFQSEIGMGPHGRIVPWPGHTPAEIVKWPSGAYRWTMTTTPEVAHAIHEKLGLSYHLAGIDDGFGVVHLPEHIGNAAAVFDSGDDFQHYVIDDNRNEDPEDY